MKVLGPLLSLFLFCPCASAQALPDPSGAPGVAVEQKKWRMEVRNPALEKDVFRAIKEREREVIEQREIVRQNESRTRQGLPTLPPPVRQPAPEGGPRGLLFTYVYEVKIKNTGEKAIRTLTWDYVFFEPGTQREAGRRRFVSEVSIRPGKTKNLVAHSRSSPTGTVDASKADKKARDQYSEQVVIRSIGYADGSAWPAASN